MLSNANRFFWVLVWVVLAACNPKPQTPKTLVIALTKERKIDGKKYGEWLMRADSNLRFIYLSDVAPHDLADSLSIADAVLFTGGADIHPTLYGKAFDTIRCGPIDRERDHYELETFRIARSLNLPILGICRGLQMINVAMGGTLYVDLPQDKGSGELHRKGDEGWAEHPVTLIPGSLIATYIKSPIVNVASNHHQGIEQLAPGLAATATSPDMLIEAVEHQAGSKQWIMAVQWHPEWMDPNDTLSLMIAKGFLAEAAAFQKRKR